jgi:hypothetical protein
MDGTTHRQTKAAVVRHNLLQGFRILGFGFGFGFGFEFGFGFKLGLGYGLG